MPRYAELVYNGFWFSPERRALQAAIDETQKYCTGTVRVKLYKVRASTEYISRMCVGMICSSCSTYNVAHQLTHASLDGGVVQESLPEHAVCCFHGVLHAIQKVAACLCLKVPL